MSVISEGVESDSGDPEVRSIDVNSPAARKWAMAAISVPVRSADEAVGHKSSISKSRPRVRASSSTRSGWFIAASPLWYAVSLILLALGAGGFSWLEIALVTGIAGGALYLAAGFDSGELLRRGFEAPPSKQLIWASPLVFLIFRGQRTRDDFKSYRLAWAHFFFGLLAGFVIVESDLAVTWILGTANLR